MREKFQKSLDVLSNALSPFTNILKNWYAKRYGKNADAKNLYFWAAENNYSIIRFNPIPTSKCLMIIPRNYYVAFEVEVISNSLKKGFHVAFLFDIISVTPVESEVGLSALEFKEAFRLEDGEVELYKSGF